MKNIFILPTVDESNLYTDLDFKLSLRNSLQNNNRFEVNQFIYITNGEGLTLNGYHFNSKYGDEPQKTNQRDIDSRKYWEEEDYCIIKIVLTNDPKLIADGVQELTKEQLRQIITVPLDYVEVVREEEGQYVDRFPDGSIEEGIYENYSLVFNPFSAERQKHIKEFEILEGISYDKFDEKDLARFERFVESREKERTEDLNNKDNWEFDTSSGYAGYRNVMTGDWIYEPVYLELFAEKEKTEKLYTEKEVETLIEDYDRQFKLDTFAYTLPCNYTPKEWFNKIKK